VHNYLFDKRVWIDAWRNDPHTALRIMERFDQGSNSTEEFKKWAQSYNKSSFSDEGRRRSDRILTWVEHQIGTFENRSVLDIGAASGSFSIPFAERGALVTAVEPSYDMASMLKSNAALYTVDVKIIQQSFEELVEKHENSYDLVFASMCPAMKDWDAVERAIRLANKYCYISFMAGPKENGIMVELLQSLGLKSTIESSDMSYLQHLTSTELLLLGVFFILVFLLEATYNYVKWKRDEVEV